MWEFSARIVAAAMMVAAVPLSAWACGDEGGARLVVAFDTKSNPPRVMGEGTEIDRDRPGISVDVLCEAARRAGLGLELKRVPWARGLHLIEHNQIDGLFNASFTPERQAIMVYPTRGGRPDPDRALFQQSYVLYARPGSGVQWDGTALAGLDGRAVGVTRGYVIGALLRADGVAVEEEETPAANFRKLLAGRVAAVADLEGIADRMIADTPELASGVRKFPAKLRQAPYYLVLSRAFFAGNPAAAERLWQEIRAVNLSPALGRIQARYAND